MMWGTAAGSAKVAVALRAAVIESVHVAAVPVQAPDQPVNLEPVVVAAVRVTVVPLG